MAQKFLEIVRHWSEQGLHLERVYRNIQDRELFLLAYGRLYANKGATTPGVDPTDTIDGMSLKRIDDIIAQLKQGTYRWQPVQRVEIPKKNGKTRPIGKLVWSDKLLQEVMRLVLEAYYEPRFSNHSHGFRPGRGCHTALAEIQSTWSGTKWFIEGDIESCFDSLSPTVILNIIARDIKDRKFLKLLKEMLQAGYMWQRQFHHTYSGAPQGSGASPILANIVLNELDRYVENCLIPPYNKGKKRRLNPKYQQLTYAMSQARQKGDIEQHKRLKRERQSIPSVDPDAPNFCRLRYIRYCDDFLLGFTGSRQDALAIKGEIQSFLQSIGLALSAEKTLITHATNSRARFLGYEIYTGRENTKLTRHQTQPACKIRALNGKVVLSVPKDAADKWKSQFTKKGEPTLRPYLLNCSDYEIVQTYGVEFQGLVNYYTMAHNVSTRLYPVKYAYQQSLVRTLAAKHKQSMAWVYRHYARKSEHDVTGFMVEVPNPHNPDSPLVAKFGDKPIRYHPHAIIKDTVPQLYHGRNELVRRLLAQECELCGTTDNIEVHHVRKLKDIRKKYQGQREPPQWVKFMIARHRKTVVVCHPCHRAIHGGKYDGRKLELRLTGKPAETETLTAGLAGGGWKSGPAMPD